VQYEYPMAKEAEKEEKKRRKGNEKNHEIL
jgi:hypothetical protein